MKQIQYLLALLVLTNVSQSAIFEVNDTYGSGVHADQSGNLYFYDVNVDSVFMMDASYSCTVANGNCVVTEIIDSLGDNNGRILDRPTSVAVDSKGHIYVAGQTSNNVFRINNPDVCLSNCISEIVDNTGANINGLGTPVSVQVDSNDNVYIAGAGSDNVLRVAASEFCSTTGTLCSITEIIDSTGDDGAGPNEVNQPVGLAIDSEDSVFVTTQNSDNVYKIATPGTCNTTAGNCTITEIINDSTLTTQAFGRGIVVDSQDNVYMTEIGFFQLPAVYKISTPGTCSTGGTPCTITKIFETALPQQAGNMAVDDADNIFFAGGNGDNAYKIDTPNSCSTTTTPCVITEIIDSTGDGSAVLDGTSNVAVAFGQVYVSAGGSDNIFRITDVAVSYDLIFQDGFE